MCEMLWSDPQPQQGRSPSKRGVGVAFGECTAHAYFPFGRAPSPQPDSEDNRAATRPRTMLNRDCVCCGTCYRLHSD